MSTSNADDQGGLPEPMDGVIDAEETALPQPTRTGHAKMPEDLDDDAYQVAAEEERVAAGLEDFAPSQVPPATDPLPPGSSEEADRAQRGLDQKSDEERNDG